MFKIFAIALLIAVAAFLIYAAAKPDAFRIERTRSINAPPQTLFVLVNDLHRFNGWNPFAQQDPSLKIAYSGPGSGVGAAYTWNGSGKSGAGRMEITASSPPSRVAMRLDFSKPFEAHNKVEFSITPDGPASKVTWTMTGRNGYMHKVMGTLFNMDKMVGGEFDKGLGNLQSVAE